MSIYSVKVFTAKPQTAQVQPQYETIPVKENPPTVEELFKLVNEERAKVGVKPLILDPRLNKSAQEKADELVKEGWDSTPHVNNAGKHGYQLIGEVAPECKVGSENLATQITSKRIVDSWNDSPKHKEAMSNQNFTITGFGIAKAKYTYYTTEHFC